MGRVAQKEENTNLKEFDDPELAVAFDDLTKALKNVEIHTVSEKAARAVTLTRKKTEASTTGRILLDHKLFMQAYTVMREMIGSFGLITMKKKRDRFFQELKEIQQLTAQHFLQREA